MRFEEAYGGWKQGRITQEEAAQQEGDGLIDKRMNQVSHQKAPVDEMLAYKAK